MDLFAHPYASFLAEVNKPGRYIGAEHGAIKKDWDSVEARVCLAFPDVYDIGMSHLGYRILYNLLNADSRILAERCYTPYVDMLAKLEERGLPIASLESVRALREFDMVGFSLQFELTYTNVLLMIDRGGIPLRAADRGEEDPLVVAGGPVATHAEAVAPFFDAILVGDGEEAAKEMVLSWMAGKKAGKTRRERLEDLAQLTGVYVPSLYGTEVDPDTGFHVVSRPTELDHQGRLPPFPIERRLVPDLNEYPFPDTFPVGGPEAIFDRMSIEVARGCTEGCRFCQAGMIYRPVRERDPKDVVDTVLRALEKSGQDEVSLTALSTADVSCISPLIKRLVEKTAPERVSLSVASLRAYGLAEELLDDMRKVRASGLTFAPEAGTQRMRDVINKNVTEEQLLQTAERVFSRGFDKMKLYFILGLPTETDEDVLGIAQVGQNALNVGRRVGKRPNVTVSVSVHVPKPHTPFQWCKMDDLEEVQRKQGMLRAALRGKKGITLRLHDSTTSELEGVLARGDRRIADVVESAYRSGAHFDSWDDHYKAQAWDDAFAEHGIERAPFLDTLPLSARLPWDHLDIGLEDGFLAREYKKALSSRLSPPCGKARGMFIHHTNTVDAAADERKLVCYDCGIACDLGRMRSERLRFLGEMGATDRAQRAVLPVLNTPPPTAPVAPPLDVTMPPAAAAPASPPPDVTMLDEPLDDEPLDDASIDDQLALAAEDPAGLAGAATPSPQKSPAAPTRARRPEFYRPPRPGSAPVRLRLAFEKTGPSALIGHLDLIRELPRVVRRAGVRTAYTEGFHPKPDMSFGPALALGLVSLDEYVDIKLIDPPPAAELIECLNRASSGGLRFHGAVWLGPNDPGIAKIINRADYLLGVPEAELGPDPEALLRKRLAAYEARPDVGVWRDVKGIKRLIDVRAGVTTLTLAGDEAVPSVRRAGVVGRLRWLAATVPISPSGAVRSREIVEALFERADVPHLGIRVALRGGEWSPLDLGRHQKVAAPSVLKQVVVDEGVAFESAPLEISPA